MSGPLIKFVAHPSLHGEAISAWYNFQKQDSQPLSIFQAIGISYLVRDAMIELDAKHANAAAGFFVSTLVGDGWATDTAQKLLMETDWKRRMYSAWCLIGDEERTSAAKLDYGVYQNYWPSVDFCEEAFDADVRRWISDPLNFEPASNGVSSSATRH